VLAWKVSIGRPGGRFLRVAKALAYGLICASLNLGERVLPRYLDGPFEKLLRIVPVFSPFL
jgi:hypothetical protein